MKTLLPVSFPGYVPFRSDVRRSAERGGTTVFVKHHLVKYVSPLDTKHRNHKTKATDYGNWPLQKAVKRLEKKKKKIREKKRKLLLLINIKTRLKSRNVSRMDVLIRELIPNYDHFEILPLVRGSLIPEDTWGK